MNWNAYPSRIPLEFTLGVNDDTVEKAPAGGLTGLGKGFLTKKYLLAQGAEDAEEEEI